MSEVVQESVPVSLSRAHPGWIGEILSVSGQGSPHSEELERRLLEFGLVEGSVVEVLHEGPVGRDPLAVRIDGMRLALRRRDAQGVMLKLLRDDSL